MGIFAKNKKTHNGILFWNIKDFPSERKKEQIQYLLTEKEPAIFCIAEGTNSIVQCNRIVQFIEEQGYKCFYNPLFYQNEQIHYSLDWNPKGLKVFIKKEIEVDKFQFNFQQHDGRIVFIPFKTKTNEHYLVFLIHCYSKQKDDYDRITFFNRLNDFIKLKKQQYPKIKKTIIAGDFNTEPWENIVQRKKGIKSYFLEKRYHFYKERQTTGKVIFYNPFSEYIQKHPKPDLIGTFYNKNYISLIDFALFSSEIENTDYEIEIINKISNTDLLIPQNTKVLIENGFDHLPISIELKK